MTIRSLRTTTALLALAAGLSLSAGPAAAQGTAPLDKAAVEKIVRDYILENPEIIVEAMQALQQKEDAAKAAAVAEALAANRVELFESDFSPVLGNPKGDVTLVEFFDYQCGYCKRAHPQRKAAVEADGKVRVVMKEFPILGPASVEAAKTALAAKKQGKYEQVHEALITQTGQLNSAAIREIAMKAGLDMERLAKDMEAPDVLAEIEANYALARSLDIRGTPGFVVGETIIPGMIGREEFTQLFDAERAAKKGG